jgi:hypothetical protein
MFDGFGFFALPAFRWRRVFRQAMIILAAAMLGSAPLLAEPFKPQPPRLDRPATPRADYSNAGPRASQSGTILGAQIERPGAPDPIARAARARAAKEPQFTDILGFYINIEGSAQKPAFLLNVSPLAAAQAAALSPPDAPRAGYSGFFNNLSSLFNSETQAQMLYALARPTIRDDGRVSFSVLGIGNYMLFSDREGGLRMVNLNSGYQVRVSRASPSSVQSRDLTAQPEINDFDVLPSGQTQPRLYRLAKETLGLFFHPFASFLYLLLIVGYLIWKILKRFA